MNTSRRSFIKILGVGGAALVASESRKSLAEEIKPAANSMPIPPAPLPPPADMSLVSSAERNLRIVNFDLLEEEARTLISPARFAFMGPAGAGVTYRENLRAFNDYPINPRRLQGVRETNIDTSTTLLGHRLPAPILTCPMGGQGMFHTQAEVPSATGTGLAKALFVMSGAAHKTLEDVAEATEGPKWFQIYMNKDMELNRWLVQRAKKAGFSAIVLTADALGPNPAEEWVRLGSPRAPGMVQGNHDPAREGRGNFLDWKRDISFKDIQFLSKASGLPVVVKGVVHPEDIRRALSAGAAGIWVSNHGGRQLDGVAGAFDMLGRAVDTVNGKVPIIFDSGIRRGIDVFKALAMGATVVGIGRPVLWGLICGGASGVKSVYDHITAELRTAMLLAGVQDIKSLKRTNLLFPKDLGRCK